MTNFFYDYHVRQNENHHKCCVESCGLEAMLQILELRVRTEPVIAGEGIETLHYHVCERHGEEYINYQEALR